MGYSVDDKKPSPLVDLKASELEELSNFVIPDVRFYIASMQKIAMLYS